MQFFPCRCIPYLDLGGVWLGWIRWLTSLPSIVIKDTRLAIGGHEVFAVGTECQCGEDVNVPLQGSHLLPGGCVPDLDRLVMASRGNVLVIETECDAGYTKLVPLESEQFLSGFQVKDFGCVVLAA